MNAPAKIAIGLLVVASLAATIWFADIGLSGPTLQDQAEKERAEQRGHNAEICRLARDRLRQLRPDRKDGDDEREQNEAVIRVKFEPLGL